MSGLTFDALRDANTRRLPQFKNKHGKAAHSKPDGSDWSPAQWLQAVVGELGEYANLRKKFERGDVGPAEFLKEAADELADVVTYLDILAFQLGIDLGMATADKFNRVSERVACDVRLYPYASPPIAADAGETILARPCCGEYTTCQRACTPRGRELYKLELARCDKLMADAAPPVPVVDNAKRTQEGDLPRASGQNLHGRTLSAAGVAKPADVGSSEGVTARRDEQPSPTARAPSADELTTNLRHDAERGDVDSFVRRDCLQAASALEAAAKREEEWREELAARDTHLESFVVKVKAQQETIERLQKSHTEAWNRSVRDGQTIAAAESLAESYKAALVAADAMGATISSYSPGDDWCPSLRVVLQEYRDARALVGKGEGK